MKTANNKKENQLTFPLNYCTPREYQIPIFAAIDRGIKRILMCWSRQIGKDTTSFLIMVGQAMRHPGNYFYIFPTRETAKKAVWEKIDKDGVALLSCIPKSRLLRKSDQEMQIKVKSGADGKGESTIRFVGLDYNPDSIRGITPRGLVFSEFAYQDPDVYKTILPALQQYPDAWVIYNSTPNGKNHFYDLFLRTEKAVGWLNSYHQVLYPDRPGYIPNLIKREDILMMQAESGLTDEFIEQEFGCSFEIGSRGSIYGKAMNDARNSGRICKVPHNKYKRVDTFWDLGIADPTVIWFRQMDGTRECWFDYLKTHNSDYADIILMLKDKGYRYGTHWLPHDGNKTSQQTHLQDSEFVEHLLGEFQVTGEVEVCPKMAKKSSINGLRSIFSNFYFDIDRCAEGIKDLDNYHYMYDKKRKVYSQDPSDNHFSHSCDALSTRVAAIELTVSREKEFEKELKVKYYDFNPLDY